MVTPKKQQFAFGSSAQQSSPYGGTAVESTLLGPEVAVIFKGLQKRDAVTKGKASDDLLDYLNTIGGGEDENAQDALIKSWMALYSTLAIDADKKVRTNSHVVLGRLVTKYKRKTARYLAQIAAFWTLGRFDEDRSVSRAANDAFNSSFATEDKRAEFRRVFEDAVFDKMVDLMFDQTAASLSDSRFITAHDADAKYSNIVSAAIGALGELAELNDESCKKTCIVLDKSSFWKHVCGEDAAIQRAGLKLLNILIGPKTFAVHEGQIRKNIAPLLNKTRSTNVLFMTTLLHSIATIEPDLLFQPEEGNKKSVYNRILKFVKNASAPGLSPDYWPSMLDVLSQAVKSTNASDDVLFPLLESFETSSFSAPRGHRTQSVGAYCNLCIAYIGAGSLASKNKFCEVFSQDLIRLTPLLAYADPLQRLYAMKPTVVEEVLQMLNDHAQALSRSQNMGDLTVLHEFLTLHQNLLLDSNLHSFCVAQLRSTISVAVKQIVPDSVGYQFVCLALASLNSDELLEDSQLRALLVHLIKDLPDKALSRPDQTAELFISIFSNTSTSSGDQDKTRALGELLSAPSAHGDTGPTFVLRLLESGVNPSALAITSWIVEDLQRTHTLTTDRWNVYVKYLSLWPDTPDTAKAFMLLVKRILEGAPNRSDDLLTLLLCLLKTPDTLQILPESDLISLSNALWDLSSHCSEETFREILVAFGESGDQIIARSMDTVLLERISQTTSSSIPIQDLSVRARPLLSQKCFAPLISTLMEASLQKILPSFVPRQLSILHPIGILASYTGNDRGTNTCEVSTFDAQCYSTFLRGLSLLSDVSILETPEKCFYSLMAHELIVAKLQHNDANNVYLPVADSTHNQETWQSLGDSLVEDLSPLCNMILAKDGQQVSALVGMFESKRSHSPDAMYRALAFYRLLDKCREDGLGSDRIEMIYSLTSKDLFLSVACCAALSEPLLISKKGTFQRNKLSSDLSGKLGEEQFRETLIRLNALIPVEEVETPILPRQRLMFLLKHLLEHAQVHLKDRVVTFEMVTLLIRLLPEVKSEYGSHWLLTIEWLIEALNSANTEPSDVSLQYMSLKLLSWLSINYESNDDLSEFWINCRKRVQQVIVATFLSSAEQNANSQADNLCCLIASRLMRTVPVESLSDTDRQDLIPLVSNGLEQVQLSAYAALQNIVDEERGEMIMISALAKEYEEVSVELPAELLSIVLDHPIEDESELQNIPALLPTRLRGYCMSWALIFRYFQDTPLRMRVKLIGDLQVMDLIEPLLGFIFSVLRLEEDKPADVSRVSKKNLDTEFVDGSGELLAYAAHVYYLCLLHVPALVRGWWIDCKDRPLSAAVEQLTEKNYSLSLIQSDVESLQSEQSKALLKDENLSVRVSNAGRDIFTTYEIDEQKMEMAIRLPANYPLRRVTVESLQRIGVKDAQWRAWLLASQAVLTAQNGSILDAISLFQRNVSLHFEGVADCNICFSVLSVQDKSLPSKKCQTCKNLFHSSCLFKWFKSSSQSRCPLCRTSFAF